MPDDLRPLPSVPADAPPGRSLPAWLFPALGVAFVAGVGFIFVRGCAVEPVTRIDPDAVTRAAENPWSSLMTDLRRQTDPVGCRAALDRLSTALALNPDTALQPAALTPPDAETLQKALALTDREINELRPATYSSLDAHYLAECLYLRDAARSLDSAKLAPLERARRAFDWTNRQVADHAWIIANSQGQGTAMPPVPPTAVLNRGSGSSYERALVFLSIARQLGLDGCFVGSPEAATRSWAYSREAGKPPTGPMWGVGVLIGKDIYLFDPTRNEPFPAPGGKPATLAQLQADPNLLKPWRDDQARPWTIPDAEIKNAVVYPSAQLSAFAPRMVKLEQELRPEVPPVRLVRSWPKLVETFAVAGRPVAAWNPAEAYTQVRRLASFLPPKEGGFSPLPDLPRQLYASQLPSGLLGSDSPVGGIERLQEAVFTRYAAAFLAPPSAKERIVRGQFSEVVPALVARLQDFQAAEDRLRADRNRDPAKIEAFQSELGAVEAQKRLARDRERDAPGQLTLQAKEAEAKLFRTHATAAEALVDLALAEVGVAEATFLIALAMHEQAERAQSRGDKSAPRAWAEASGWWTSYAPYAARQERSFPGRAALAARLRARAEKLAG